MQLLAVIDMQNDFIDGALGTKQAEAIVQNVAAKIEAYRAKGQAIAFTRDTHGTDYLKTQEGRLLPIVHCVEGTRGWRISDRLNTDGAPIFNKPAFGSAALADYAVSLTGLEEIEVVGLCTDICVISNALLLKAVLPETKITVDSSCCAGVTPETHENALNAMRMCQVCIV